MLWKRLVRDTVIRMIKKIAHGQFYLQQFLFKIMNFQMRIFFCPNELCKQWRLIATFFLAPVNFKHSLVIWPPANQRMCWIACHMLLNLVPVNIITVFYSIHERSCLRIFLNVCQCRRNMYQNCTFWLFWILKINVFIVFCSKNPYLYAWNFVRRNKFQWSARSTFKYHLHNKDLCGRRLWWQRNTTQLKKLICIKENPHFLSYYRNEPVIFSHCVHLKLRHRFHALLKVCSDRDDIVPWKKRCAFTQMCLYANETDITCRNWGVDCVCSMRVSISQCNVSYFVKVNMFLFKKMFLTTLPLYSSFVYFTKCTMIKNLGQLMRLQDFPS